jgi:bifunctional DNase/RNase
MNAEMVPVTISGVVKTIGNESGTAGKVPYYIRLTETGGDRQMWIGVGQAEAAALALTLSRNELPRPMTYQFTAALLAAAGARLQEIRVTRLTDGIFYAQVLLTSEAIIDARPSDALNLAAINDVPVYAAAELLDLGTQSSCPDSPHERPTITAVRYDPAPEPEQE